MVVVLLLVIPMGATGSIMMSTLLMSLKDKIFQLALLQRAVQLVLEQLF